MLPETDIFTQHPDDHAGEHFILPYSSRPFCQRCGLVGAENIKNLGCCREDQSAIKKPVLYLVVKSRYRGHFLAINEVDRTLQCLRCSVFSTDGLTTFHQVCRRADSVLTVAESQLKYSKMDIITYPTDLADSRSIREHYHDCLVNIPPELKGGG